MVVDRLEGSLAVVETAHGMKNIPLSSIDGDVSDGTVLVTIGENRYKVDEAATHNRRENNANKLQKLFNVTKSN